MNLPSKKQAKKFLKSNQKMIVHYEKIDVWNKLRKEALKCRAALLRNSK